MTNDKDGGQAFPSMAADGHKDYRPGLSMRDWFAGHMVAEAYRIAPGIPEYELRSMFGERTGIKREEITAAIAYRIADAMLAARRS